jgi:hypothetical protein
VVREAHIVQDRARTISSAAESCAAQEGRTMEMKPRMEARQVAYLGRQAVTLGNEAVVCTVEALGSMVPLFAARRRGGALNAHWIPDFRGIDSAPWSEERHTRYFGAKVLYLLAGEFPCSPNFGDPCTVGGVELPVHGWTATETWTLERVGLEPESGGAFACSSLRSPAAGMPLVWEKLDLVLPRQPVHFSALRIRNEGEAEITVNLVRHNTIGPPFLEAGCRIALSAERFMAAPAGTEYDATGRLAQGVEFESLAGAPLRAGGTVDLREVPGITGSTDFVTGAIASHLPLGWSCVASPRQALAYLCFFPGAAGLPEGELTLAFNDLWMQYGGRPYPPWALHEGGVDRTYCLGTENGTAAFGNGLAWSREHPRLLGRETVVAIPGQTARTLWYATALLPLEPALAREGVASVELDGGALLLRGPRAHQPAAVSGDFAAARAVASRIFL